jgi:hypothetical protein
VGGDKFGNVVVVGDAIGGVSTLGRAGVAGDVGLDITVGDVGGFSARESLAGVLSIEVFLLQKESNPPPVLSLDESAAVTGFSSGSRFRSHPHSSFAAAF